MSIIELKEKLISKINITNNDEVLQGMLRFLDFESKSGVYKLDEDQKNSIGLAREQMNSGEFYTEDEANILTDKWLNK